MNEYINTQTMNLVGFIATSVLFRIIPNIVIEKYGYRIGKAMSVFGNTKIPMIYEKIETYVQNSLGIFFIAMNKGLNHDEKTHQPTNRLKGRVKR